MWMIVDQSGGLPMSDEDKKHGDHDGRQVGRPPTVQPRWIRWLGVIVLAFLALHSFSYGSGFVLDPVVGAGEFGDNTPPSEAAAHLVGLVGVILLLLALTAVVAAILLLRGRPGGAWLTLGLGIAMLSIGAYWATLGSTWDAGIYSGIGFLLTGTGALSVWYAK
jgi:hypothetical protein